MFSNNQLNLQLLKLLFSNKDFYTLNNIFVQSEYFENKTYKNFVKFLKTYTDKYHHLPTKDIILEVANKKENFFDLNILNEIFNTEVTEENIQFICNEISYYYKKSEFLQAIADAYGELMNKDEVDEKIFDSHFKKFKDIIVNSKKIDLGFSIFDIEKRYEEDEELNSPFKINYPILAQQLQGGFYRGRLYLFIAPPGYGKSLTLQNIAVNLFRNGYKIVYYTFTTELSKEEVAQRVDIIISQQEKFKLLASTKLLEESLKFFKEKQGDIIYYELGNRSNVLEIQSHLELLRLKKNFYPDVILVDYADYLQPLHTEKWWGNSYHILGEVFKDLKSFARENGAALITASQTNREALETDVEERGGTKDSGSLVDVSGSFQKQEVVDFSAQLIRTKSDKKLNRMRLHILKNRFGDTDLKIVYNIIPHLFTISEEGIK